MIAVRINERRGNKMSKRVGIATLGLVVTLVSPAVFAQAPQDYSKIEIKSTDLGHNTYMLEGQGGNITVIAGTDGIIMVDAQYIPLHDKIKAAIAKFTNQPVKYVIDTHFHVDHVNGNPSY